MYAQPFRKRETIRRIRSDLYLLGSICLNGPKDFCDYLLTGVSRSTRRVRLSGFLLSDEARALSGVLFFITIGRLP